MNRFTIFNRLVLIAVLLIGSVSSSASAQSTLSTVIPYQGQLNVGGAPATTPHDFEFKLFDAATAGTQIGSTNSKDNVSVTSGNFAVELDFGGAAFNGAARFLQIGVRAGDSTGAFTTLTPRRPLLAVPYALYSPSGSKPAYGMAANAPNNATYIASNGNVGIGTTDPQSALHISTTASSYGALRIFNPTTSGEASLAFSDADGPIWGVGMGGYEIPNNFYIGSDSGPKVMIKNNGNVGIGTTDPQSALHINTTASSGGAIRITNPTNGQTSEASIGFSDSDGPAWGVGVGGYSTPNQFYIGSTSGAKLFIEDNGIVTVMGTLGVRGQMIMGNDFVMAANDRGDGGRAMVHLAGDILKINYGGELAGGTVFDGKVGIGMDPGSALLSVGGDASVRSLQIRGGADLAEPFNMTDHTKIEPGMVVVIDPENPGQLRLANNAYNRMVAGVVSGAGGVNSGLIMQQEGTVAAGEHPVALTGRVYVWVDASKTPVNPGDLLTTSDTPGHAMKVTDHIKAQGAILGKAMGTLEKGKGLVLMLVSLQ